VNRGYGRAFFWDGRTTSLEEQVLKPIQDPTEMGLSLAGAVGRLTEHGEYRVRFVDAFGRPPTTENLSRALASYVRTILSGDSPVDRYLEGDSGALSAAAIAGLELFRGKANCTACHTGPNFTDEEFHNTGVAWREGTFQDLGRELVTGQEEASGAFKTPTLRNVRMTAPYMHDGSLSTLEEVVEFYDRGGNGNPYLDREVRNLNLSNDEKDALLEFLRSLDAIVQDGL
jgi:cytochrome c peroxidase